MWRNALENLEGHNKGSKLMFYPSSITLFLAAPAIPVTDAQSRRRVRTEIKADRLVLTCEYLQGVLTSHRKGAVASPATTSRSPRVNGRAAAQRAGRTSGNAGGALRPKAKPIDAWIG